MAVKYVLVDPPMLTLMEHSVYNATLVSLIKISINLSTKLSVKHYVPKLNSKEQTHICINVGSVPMVVLYVMTQQQITAQAVEIIVDKPISSSTLVQHAH